MSKLIDVAIRKNYFEDTIVLLGDFNLAGHNLNYVIRVSSYGTRFGENKVRVYFALLDDTLRQYDEEIIDYSADEVILDENRLLIRTDKFEIKDVGDEISVYFNYKTIIFDFNIRFKCEKIQIKRFGKPVEGGKVDTYAYPECITEGHATTDDKYHEIHGKLFYVRHAQNFENILTRKFKINRAVDVNRPHIMFAFYSLTNGRKLILGSFTHQDEHIDQLGIMIHMDFHEKDIEPLRKSITEYMNQENKEGLILKLNINAFDNRFALKCKTAFNINEGMSPADLEFTMYDKFVRCGGIYDNEKVSGYGYMVLF